jgi:hypothetical protein
VEYPDRETYLRDVNHEFKITEDVDGRPMKVDNKMSKGYLLQFLPKVFEKKFDEDKHIYKGFWIYPPRLNMDQNQYDSWALNTISTWQKDYPEIAESHFFDRILYWKINNAHTVTIPRDKEWFAKVLPVLTDTWEKVCYYREHLEDLPVVQEIANKRKAFYRYKSEFKVNNYEPNTDFLSSKTKPVSYTKPTSSYKNNNFKSNNYFYKYMKINSNSNNNVDSIDNYSGKNIEDDSSSLWRDKVEYVDLSSSITTTEITKNSRSLPLFLLGNSFSIYC